MHGSPRFVSGFLRKTDFTGQVPALQGLHFREDSDFSCVGIGTRLSPAGINDTLSAIIANHSGG
jgi:hypothetical protein